MTEEARQIDERTLANLRDGRSVRIEGRAEDAIGSHVAVECGRARELVEVLARYRAHGAGLGWGSSWESRVRLVRSDDV